MEDIYFRHSIQEFFTDITELQTNVLKQIPQVFETFDHQFDPVSCSRVLVMFTNPRDLVVVVALGTIAILLAIYFCAWLKAGPANQASSTGRKRRSPDPAPPVAVAPVVPRRKLFLSWAAVLHAVRSGAVTEEDLDTCLFCTSAGELALAEEFDRSWFERLYPPMAKALKEGRMICNNDTRHYNNTTVKEVNELLARNGVAPLSCVEDGTLEQIPLYSAVPSVSDRSLEVLWGAHPLRGDWRHCWGRTMEELEAEFGGDDDGDETAAKPSWTDELNRPIIDELRRKHDRPQTPEGADGEQAEGEGDDPADFWKKGRPTEE